MCLRRFELTEKERRQTRQLNGFSPVCMCECTAKAEGLVKRLSHAVQNWRHAHRQRHFGYKKREKKRVRKGMKEKRTYLPAVEFAVGGSEPLLAPSLDATSEPATE